MTLSDNTVTHRHMYACDTYSDMPTHTSHTVTYIPTHVHRHTHNTRKHTHAHTHVSVDGVTVNKFSDLPQRQSLVHILEPKCEVTEGSQA